MTMQSALAWNNRGVLSFCHSDKGNRPLPLSPDAWIRALQELQACPVPPPSMAQRGHPHGLDLSFDSPTRVAQSSNNTFFVNAMVQIRQTKRRPEGASHCPLACHQMTTGVVMFNLALSYHVSYQQSRNMDDYAKACRIYEIVAECLLLDGDDTRGMLDPWAFVLGVAALYNGAVLAQDDGNTASFDDSMETILEWIQDWNCIICTGDKALHGLVSEIHTNALLASCALFPGSLCTAPAA